MPYINGTPGMRDIPQAPQTGGSGMLQSAAEILKLRPFWEDEYNNGQTDKQFSDWIRDPEVQQRYQNVTKVMPPMNGY